MSVSFKLLSFNVYDDESSKSEDNEENNGYVPCKDREFMIQMFGINEKGETASIFVEGFTPFFYVMVDDNWGDREKNGFIGELYQQIGSKYWEGTIVKSMFVKKKKIVWVFSG